MGPRCIYEIDQGNLVIRDGDEGAILWQGRPDDVPVTSVVALPGGTDAIVLLDYMARAGLFLNLIRFGADGDIQWRAELPTSDSQDRYVFAAMVDHGLVANSWSGYRVALDEKTGTIIRSEFVK